MVIARAEEKRETVVVRPIANNALVGL